MKTIDDLIKEYLEHIRSMKYSPSTVRQTAMKLKRLSRWLKGKQVETIAGLNLDHLRKWHEYLSGLCTKAGYPIKASTLNRNITGTRGFIKYLISYGYIQSRYLAMLPYVKEPRPLPGSVMTHKQVRKFLSKTSTDNTSGYRNRAMLELLYSSGIRSSELLKLDVSDIDFNHHTAQINGKGNKQRVVPIGKTAMRYLETYVAGVRPYMVHDKTEKALFVSKYGNRLTYSGLREVIRVASIHAKPDVNVTAHTFRRSCTTELIRGDANIYHVKELLGHESLDTLKPYTRLTIIDLKKTHAKCHPRERDEK